MRKKRPLLKTPLLIVPFSEQLTPLSLYSSDGAYRETLLQTAKKIAAKMTMTLAKQQRPAETGNLHMRRAARMVASKTPLYARKMAAAGSNQVEMTLLLDISGSMTDNRGKLREAAVVCAYCAQCLGVTIKTYAFSTVGVRSVDKILDNLVGARLQDAHIGELLSNKFIPVPTIYNCGRTPIEVDAFAAVIGSRVPMSQNLDHTAIRFVRRGVEASPCKYKGVVVISDGLPFGASRAIGQNEQGWDSPDAEYDLLKKEVRLLESATPSVVGVGFGDDNVREFYKKHIVGKQKASLIVDEVMKLMLELLSKRENR
ncbi:MAG: hypothetical protein JXK05_06505 [Campylobacterales bacterium]|nr:hypothetical protein [Campylobacterales bacterium]